MKIHPTLQKILAVAAALLLFVGVTRLIKWYNHFEVDPEVFNNAADIDALIAAESVNVPQLELAYQNGLTTSIGRSFPLQDLDRTLTIDRVWVTSNTGNGNVYLLYHLDMHRSDDTPKDVPALTFSKVVFTAPKGGKLKSNVQLMHKSRGHAYNRDFYRSMIMNPEQINAFHNPWFTRKLKSVTLVNPRIISGNRTIKLDNITLEINHNYYKRRLANFPIDRKIGLKNGTTIHFRSFEARLNINNLKFSISSPKPVTTVGLAIEGLGETSVSIQDQDIYIARFSPFMKVMPENINIQLTFIEYKNKDQTNKISLHDKKIKVKIPSNKKNHPASDSSETR